jgi:flavodoxin
MKIAIIYTSKHGRTEKVAKSIAGIFIGQIIIIKHETI